MAALSVVIVLGIITAVALKKNWVNVPSVVTNNPLAPTPVSYTNIGGFRQVINDYKVNEAAADAKYLNKGFEFAMNPGGIENEKDGRYFAWECYFGGNRDKHIKCFFRKDQTDKVAAFKSGGLKVRGICAGKVGTITTVMELWNPEQLPVIGDTKSSVDYPVIEFRDCEIVD
jgi:hypothetical protein